MGRLKLQGLTAALYLLQPLARLWGKLHHGLTPWRRRGLGGLVLPRPHARAIWCEAWKSPETWLQTVVARLRDGHACVLLGGAYDRWDLEVRGGTLGAARLLMSAEDHGAGHQYLRFRIWPRWPAVSAAAALLFVALAAGAALGQAWLACAALAAAAALVVGRALWDSAVAASALRRTLMWLEEAQRDA